jgi:uracil DNA glycosylase
MTQPIVNTNWNDTITTLYEKHKKRIDKVLDNYDGCLPEKQNIFRAFECFNVEELKVVILSSAL